MPRFAIVGTFALAPEQRDRFVALLMAHRARCLKDEPGTLSFEVLAPEEDATSVLSYEIYRDAAAFDVHRGGPSLAQWRAETAGMIAQVSVTRCTVVE